MIIVRQNTIFEMLPLCGISLYKRFNVNHIYLNLRFNMNHKVIAVDVTVEKGSAAKLDPHFIHIIESRYDISLRVIAECSC